ncbi:lipopolysaccharide biosynthesis protein [Jannaschia sp. LMIT008]|uniref:GumC family protein n=1 Tax=Jannaschia maritima TaxID=3032585 RepID=UPI0028112F22|nr:lipopolysaccharide biosynthesis protein [Jannaschia sp. LMIT008]
MPDVRFYLSLVLRRIHYVLILTILGLAAGFTVAELLPERYVASARLVVESEQIPGDLAATTVRTEASEQLQIIEQRILTRDRLLDMSNRLNVYDRRPGEAQPLRPDEIVSDLRGRIGIRTRGAGRSGQATLVDVSFQDANPRLAASVANEVVTLILQENVAMRTGVSGQTLEFFEQEVERLDGALAETGARIAAFQEQNRDALPDSLEFRRNQLTSGQERLLEIDREVARLRDRRDNLERLYAATGELGGGADANLTREEVELRAMREEYAANLSVLSEQNPRMRVLRQRIDGMAAIVARQRADAARAVAEGASETADAPVPLTAYDIQLADIDRQLEFLDQQRTRLQGQLEELQATIAATPANAQTINALQRDYENVRSQYDEAVAKRARAETGDMIEALSKGERISVIEQAIVPREPSSPDRTKLLAAGGGGGLLLGLGLIALLELMTSAVRRPVELVDKLEITPLATLSFIRTRGEILRRRALIGAAFATAILVVPAGLWAVDTYFMPLDLLAERVMDRLPLDRLLAVIDTAGL